MLTPLEQLEQVANDDFHLLDAVGPAEFSTVHLLELREQALERLTEFDRRKKMNIMVGCTSIGWVFAFAAAWYCQNIWLALAAIAGLLFSLTAFLAGAWMLAKKYTSRGELLHPIELIDAELSRR